MDSSINIVTMSGDMLYCKKVADAITNLVDSQSTDCRTMHVSCLMRRGLCGIQFDKYR